MLDDFGSIGGIVSGSIALVLFAGGFFTLTRRWMRRPRVVVECGNDSDFRWVLSKRDPRSVATLLSGPLAEICTTRLQVRETRGKTRAANVQVRVWVPGDSAPRGLQFMDGTDVYNVEANGRVWVRLCELFVYRHSGTTIRSAHPGIEQGRLAEIELEVIVDGRANKKRQAFVVDWGDTDQFPVVRESRL